MPYKDPNKQREYQRKRNASNRRAYFEGKTCTYCGSPDNLQLDHIDPSTKVEHRIWSWTPAKRATELQKCQILCKTCHFKKTGLENGRPIIHGNETAYRNKGCRCDVCRKAHYQRKVLYRQRRRAAGLSYS